LPKVVLIVCKNAALLKVARIVCWNAALPKVVLIVCKNAALLKVARIVCWNAALPKVALIACKNAASPESSAFAAAQTKSPA